MKQFYFHVQYVDTQGIEHFRSIQFAARDMIQAHTAGRKLVTFLAIDPEIADITAYYLESLKLS
jgi:hypothetical protein